MKLLQIVIKGNIFTFNGKLYRQCIGTAMGTRVAPSFATIFMGWLEEKVLLNTWQGTKPLSWVRFLDDILFYWHGTEQELKTFIDHLNSQHDFIKFEATYNPQERLVPFLDATITIDSDGYIQTDLYRKECAVTQYLLPSSCHPRHISSNIPFSLGYRLLRLCSKKADLKIRLQELKDDLISRGYKAKIIEDALKRVQSNPKRGSTEESGKENL